VKELTMGQTMTGTIDLDDDGACVCLRSWFARLRVRCESPLVLFPYHYLSFGTLPAPPPLRKTLPRIQSRYLVVPQWRILPFRGVDWKFRMNNLMRCSTRKTWRRDVDYQ